MKAEIVRMLLTDKGYPPYLTVKGDSAPMEVHINQSMHVQIGECIMLWKSERTERLSIATSSVNELIKRRRSW